MMEGDRSGPRPLALTRRSFVGAAGASLLAGAAAAQAVPEVPNRATGRPEPRNLPPEPLPDEQRLGVAVVGLGKLALSEIVDALGVTRRAKLAALVSGNRDKARRVGAQYGVPEDAIYDDNILGGNRLANSTGLMQALGAQVIDYSTWYDCCGFGFRHIISEREFTRSFAIDRKIKVAVEEARADVMIGHDTGCITTLDKNQWIGKAAGKDYEMPILADCQFAALVCGAHPYKIVQSHWHASPVETLMDNLRIDWEAKKAEFVAYLEEIKTGKQENLYDPRRMLTSGPGYIPLKAAR